MNILLLEDDIAYAKVLSRQLIRDEHQVIHVETGEQLLEQARQDSFDVCLLDMNLGIESSLPYIEKLRQAQKQARILVVTGYASIASTVHAIKSGADDYLPKPIDYKQLHAAMLGKKVEDIEHSEGEHATTNMQVLSAERLTWEHIQRVLAQNDGNISATARQLNMHRRTLQRKLAKKPVEQ
ncbi:response regulator [Catenovulum sp. SM1970]|nr:response regulator [Marinifaba aquimaris]